MKKWYRHDYICEGGDRESTVKIFFIPIIIKVTF